MTTDFTQFPTTFDLLHLILVLALVAAVLTLILRALRRKPEASAATGDSSASTTQHRAAQTPAAAAPAAEASSAKAQAAAIFAEPSADAALQLLALLQQNARLVDFLQEDLRGFSDADIGATARVVHEGGRKTLREYFTLEPVRSETEESRITLQAGFSATEVRLTGNVTGSPPFTGTLVHRGWKAVDVRLPRLARGHDASIIAAAEVEL